MALPHFAKEATTWGLSCDRACRGSSLPFRRGSLRYERACSLRYERGLAEARLRLSGYDAAAFATRWLAEPKLAKPAKAGGARRDRTADLLHAMQALSQLSYGPLDWPARLGRRAVAQNPEHSSGPISSLLVAADVADDVGHVLIALFLVGDEGGIVIVVVFDGLVDLNVVFRLRNDGLDLAGALLGVSFLERHQLFSLDGLRHDFGSRGSRGGTGARRGVSAGPRRWHRRNRHDLAGIGGDHRILIEIVEFLACRRANTFSSEIGFGHGAILEIFRKTVLHLASCRAAVNSALREMDAGVTPHGACVTCPPGKGHNLDSFRSPCRSPDAA